MRSLLSQPPEHVALTAQTWRSSLGQEILREVKGVIMEVRELTHYGYGVPEGTKEMLGREASCRSLGRQRGSLEPSEEKMLKEERLSASKGQRR